MEKGGVYEIQMPILPVVDGCVNVTISANAIIYQDKETVTICTKVRLLNREEWIHCV